MAAPSSSTVASSSSSTSSVAAPQSLEKLLAQALRLREQQGAASASPQYSHLLLQLRFGADGYLRRVLEALTRCVALLGRAAHVHDDLIHSALAPRGSLCADSTIFYSFLSLSRL